MTQQSAPSQQSEQKNGAALAAVDRYDGLAMVMSPAEATRRLLELQAFVKDAMVAGVDFGVIPGTQKPTLYQPGAQKLAEIYGFAHDFEDAVTVEDWEKPFFFYRRRCRLTSRRDGRYIGVGVGSCNSRETKYGARWVFDNEVPAHLDLAKLPTKEFAGRNNRTFRKYQIPNEDIYSLVNTIEKMACKRAYIHAVIAVTRSAALFTHDVEDLPDHLRGTVDDVRPWERGREDDEPGDLDQMAKGFEHAINALVARGGSPEELKAIGLAVEESPLDESRRKKVRDAYQRALAQIGKGRAQAKTDRVAERVTKRAEQGKGAPPPPSSRPVNEPPNHDGDAPSQPRVERGPGED